MNREWSKRLRPHQVTALTRTQGFSDDSKQTSHSNPIATHGTRPTTRQIQNNMIRSEYAIDRKHRDNKNGQSLVAVRNFSKWFTTLKQHAQALSTVLTDTRTASNPWVNITVNRKHYLYFGYSCQIRQKHQGHAVHHGLFIFHGACSPEETKRKRSAGDRIASMHGMKLRALIPSKVNCRIATVNRCHQQSITPGHLVHSYSLTVRTRQKKERHTWHYFLWMILQVAHSWHWTHQSTVFPAGSNAQPVRTHACNR